MLKNLLFSIAILCSTVLSAQEYALSVANPVINAAAATYSFDVFIKSMGADFQIGGCNIRLNLNNNGLCYGILGGTGVPVAPAGCPASAPNVAPMWSLALAGGSSNPTSGYLGTFPNRYINLAWANATAAGPVISSTPVLVGTVTIPITNSALLAGISFRLFGQTGAYTNQLPTATATTVSKIFNIAGIQLVANGPATTLGNTLLTSPLPVELLDFEGYKESKKNHLVWATASEKNTSHYQVERSGDNKDWKVIGTNVKASGNSAVKNKYETYDNQPLKGINYYRLVMVDNDGIVKYSKVINLISDSKKIGIFPNPASDKLTVSIPDEVEIGANALVTIKDVAGRVIATRYIGEDEHKLDIDIHSLIDGNYLINVIGDNGLNTVEKIVVQH
jgi:hypothetical protein